MRNLLLGGILAAASAGAGATPPDPIPGYTFGNSSLATAPFTLDDLERLKATLRLTDEDLVWLRKSQSVLEPQADAILDTWYGFVGSTPHLLHYFHDADGQPDAAYLTRVRDRFRRWISDTARAEYDQRWLDYQYEIGRRHHRVAKNATDDATGPRHIPFRYVVALTIPVTATLRPFLVSAVDEPAEVDAMQQAWVKAVLLQVILWSYPYVHDGDF